MSLTPIDIEQQRFSRVFRGYDSREVQQFLELLAEQVTSQNRDLNETRQALEVALRDLNGLRGREENLKATMLAAQRMIEEAREQAQKEAQLILADAQMRAERTLTKSHSEVVQIGQDIAELKRQRVRFIEELRGVINTHARLLDVHAAEAKATHNPVSLAVLEHVLPPAPPTYENKELGVQS